MIDNFITATLPFIPNLYFGEPNLSLIFQVETGVFEEDASGNIISEVENVVIQASVKNELQKNAEELAGSIGVNEILLSGRLVNPKILPDNIRSNLERGCTAELKDLASNQISRGEFRFIPVAQHRFPQITQKMGQVIRGYLKVEARI